jgi:hypothetical protein
MTPVALVAYQRGLTVLVTAQEPPEDVTGAAGVLDGGCVGGASWLAEGVPASLGWLGAALAEPAVPGWLPAVPMEPAGLAGLAV